MPRWFSRSTLVRAAWPHDVSWSSNRALQKLQRVFFCVNSASSRPPRANCSYGTRACPAAVCYQCAVRLRTGIQTSLQHFGIATTSKCSISGLAFCGFLKNFILLVIQFYCILYKHWSVTDWKFKKFKSSSTTGSLRSRVPASLLQSD